MLNLLPIVIIFLIGYFLKYFNVLGKKHADVMLKAVFYLTLPLSVFLALSKIRVNQQFLFLPIIAIIISFIIYLISLGASEQLNWDRNIIGVFIVGSIIMNIGFVLPFAIAFYGNEGLG